MKLRLPEDVKAIIEKLEENGMTSLFREIELPLCGVLASMEEEGFLVDREGIREFGKQLQVMSESCKSMVYEIAGHEFTLVEGWDD